MYGPPGRAYIYFIYGMHWMLNCVAEPEGQPAAILIRAMIPSEGLDMIAMHRQKVRPRDWTNGPARLCQALDIDSRFNGANLTDPESNLIIEPGYPVAPENRIIGPRVGIDSVPEPWRSKPWRYQIDLKSWTPPPDIHPL